MLVKTEHTDFGTWAAAARSAGLVLVACTSGFVAQTGPRGACRGAWTKGTDKGWLESVCAQCETPHDRGDGVCSSWCAIERCSAASKAVQA